MRHPTRREFLGAGLAAASGLALGSAPVLRGASPPPDDAGTPPREPVPFVPRRGFNLLEKFRAERQGPYVERDFEWMARWKLDFVRLPMDYRSWTDPRDLRKLDGEVLRDIDRVVEWGKRYGVHVNLNLHRAPARTSATRSSTRTTSTAGCWLSSGRTRRSAARPDGAHSYYHSLSRRDP